VIRRFFVIDDRRITRCEKNHSVRGGVDLTMPGFFVVHETEYAREFIEAEVSSLSFPLAVFVFGVRWGLRNFQVRDRV
jgi:hypothetical protein